MSRPLRIAMFVGAFPVISETFILRQITGLLDLGHEVDIYANQRADWSKAVQAEIEKYDLISRTTFISGPPESVLWEMPARPLAGQTWIPGADQPISNVARWLNAVPRFFRASFQAPSIAIDSLRTKEYSFQAASLSTLYRLSQLALVKKRYDACHAHFGPIGNSFRFVRRLWNAPLVVTFHGYDFCVVPRRDGPDVYKKLFATTDLVTVNSAYTCEQVQKLGCTPEKIRQLNVGVNLDEFVFTPRQLRDGEPARILSVGRLVEKKGIQFAIRALARAREAFPTLQYDIIGDGPLKSSLEKLTEELGLKSCVHFHGARDGDFVRQKMSAAHLFMLPSVTAKDGDQEGTPVSLMEAQAVGLPVLSTWHSGIPEVVRDGQSGFLVPECDVNALAERLIFLLKTPGNWSAFGRAARAHVESNYDIKKLNGQLVELYRSMVMQRI